MLLMLTTYGRANRQITYNNLPPDLQKQVLFVIQERERHLYPGKRGVVLPARIQTLYEARQFLIERFNEPICLLDDDLDFAVRREDDRTKFRQPTEDDIRQLFDGLALELETTPLVGVAAREGGNRNTEGWYEATRQMRIHALDPVFFRKHGIRFDRVKVMEDFDATLQVLATGTPNLVLNDWVTNQAGSNTEGGCSHYRTMEVQEESAKELARLWPKYVQLVRKTTKGSWNGKERTDVRVQWKKCYEDALQRIQDAGRSSEGDTEAEDEGSLPRTEIE